MTITSFCKLISIQFLFYYNFLDNTWSTTNTGVPNVEMGHCAKTLKILKLALKDIENYNSKHESLHHLNSAGYEGYQIKWLFLTDDDTLLR